MRGLKRGGITVLMRFTYDWNMLHNAQVLGGLKRDGINIMPLTWCHGTNHFALRHNEGN